MIPGDGVRVSLYLSRCNEWITPSPGVIEIRCIALSSSNGIMNIQKGATAIDG